jgi:2,4-dienoyl-CoA reductase-like NADH-dependent reductase (Old Yellow Enzyme family)
MAADALFRPFSVKGLELKNRIVMAPMTRSFSPHGVPGANVAEYYRRRAAGDVGLIVTEGVGIDRSGARNDPDVPNFHGEEALAGWGEVVKAVHGDGGKIAPQLWHVGAARNPRTTWKADRVDSPSGLSGPGKEPFTEPMSDTEIADTLDAYRRAGADAQRLGFDAIEIHGAHGYLIDQFLWEGTNARDDRFGGQSLKERAAFAAEVVKAIREGAGPDAAVILRLSQWKQQDYSVKLAKSPAEMSDWLTPLSEAGVDVFHCSQRRFWDPEFPELDGEEGLNFAGWAKKVTGKPTITVGSVGLSGEFIAAFAGEGSKPASIDGLLKRLDKEEFDLVAVGRALISDPNWVIKVREGRDAELLDFDRAHLGVLV